MLQRLLVRARYLTLVPVLALLASCLALFIRGSRLILEQLRVALVGSSDLMHLNRFEVDLLEGIDLLLVGTGCLALLAFKTWGGERAERRSEALERE